MQEKNIEEKLERLEADIQLLQDKLADPISYTQRRETPSYFNEREQAVIY